MFSAYVQYLSALETEKQLPPHLRLVQAGLVKKHMKDLKRNACICCGHKAEAVKQQLSSELSRYHLSETIIDLAGQVSDLDNQLTAKPCPSCDAALADGSKFCNKCGVAQPHDKSCVREGCGANLADGSKFCQICGKKQEKEDDGLCHVMPLR